MDSTKDPLECSNIYRQFSNLARPSTWHINESIFSSLSHPQFPLTHSLSLFLSLTSLIIVNAVNLFQPTCPNADLSSAPFFGELA